MIRESDAHGGHDGAGGACELQSQRSGSISSSGNPAGDGTVNALQRVDGPPIDRLSVYQINAIVQTCFAHHDLDDARVPYTRGYCEKVFAERDRRSLLIPGKRTVIVGGQPLKQLH